MADIATLRIEIDATGMARGVQQAQAELGKLEQTAQRSFAEIKRDISQATADFNKGKISANDYRTALDFARQEAIGLKAAVKPTGAELQAMNSVMRSTGEGSRSGAAGLNTLRSAMGSLAFTTAGLPGRLGEVSSMIGSMAYGSLATAGVFAGMAAIALLYKQMAKEANEAKKAADAAHESLLKLAQERTMRLDPTTELTKQVALERERLALAEKELARLKDRKAVSDAMLAAGVPTEAVAFVGAADVAAAQKRYDALAATVRAGEQEILEIRASMGDDALETIRRQQEIEQEALKKHLDSLKQVVASAGTTAVVGPTVSGPAAGLTRGRALGGFGYDYLGWMTVSLPEIVEKNRAASEEIKEDWVGAFAIITMAVGRNSSAMVGAVQDVIFQVQSLKRNAEETTKAVGYASIAAGGFGTGYGMGGLTTSRAGGAAIGAGTGALAGAAAGSVIPGIGTAIGAVVGGVAGLIGGLWGASKAAKAAAEEAKRAAEIEQEAAAMRRKAREELAVDFATRKAILGASNEWEKERIRLDAAWAKQQRELLDLLNAGIITLAEYERYWNITAEEHAAALKELAEQEKAAADAARDELARALREVEEAAKAAAEATRSLVESLTERGLRLTGRGAAADTFALGARQRQERLGAAGQPGEVLALMDFVHGMERKELEFNQAVDAINTGLEAQLGALEKQAQAATSAWEKEDAAYADQIELAEAALRVTEQGFAEQIKTAQEALRTAEDQLRAQERTVDELRRVVENLAEFRQGLLTSDLTTLSPARQLEVARDEFTRLAGLAMGGDVAAGQALPGASRTFLDASRGYNASGARYQGDWDAVNNVLYTVQGRFTAQLSVEERMLAALQTQVSQLSAQIGVLEAARDSAVADAQRQIGELQTAREASRAQYETQIAAIQKQINAAQQAADDQIAALRAEFEAARALWQEQLDALLEQVRLLTIIGTVTTDQPGGGQLPPPIAFDLSEIAANTAASVTVLQVGLSQVSTDLAGVRSEIADLRREVRNGLEVAV